MVPGSQGNACENFHKVYEAIPDQGNQKKRYLGKVMVTFCRGLLGQFAMI